MEKEKDREALACRISDEFFWTPDLLSTYELIISTFSVFNNCFIFITWIIQLKFEIYNKVKRKEESDAQNMPF